MEMDLLSALFENEKFLIFNKIQNSFYNSSLNRIYYFGSELRILTAEDVIKNENYKNDLENNENIFERSLLLNKLKENELIMKEEEYEQYKKKKSKKTNKSKDISPTSKIIGNKTKRDKEKKNKTPDSHNFAVNSLIYILNYSILKKKLSKIPEIILSKPLLMKNLNFSFYLEEIGSFVYLYIVVKAKETKYYKFTSDFFLNLFNFSKNLFTFHSFNYIYYSQKSINTREFKMLELAAALESKLICSFGPLNFFNYEDLVKSIDILDLIFPCESDLDKKRRLLKYKYSIFPIEYVNIYIAENELYDLKKATVSLSNYFYDIQIKDRFKSDKRQPIWNEIFGKEKIVYNKETKLRFLKTLELGHFVAFDAGNIHLIPWYKEPQFEICMDVDEIFKHLLIKIKTKIEEEEDEEQDLLEEEEISSNKEEEDKSLQENKKKI